MHLSVVLKKYKQYKIGRFGNPINRDIGLITSIPYAEPSFFQHWNSPYYNDDHRRFAAFCRDWYYQHCTPMEEIAERKNAVPKGFRKKLQQMEYIQWHSGFILGRLNIVQKYLVTWIQRSGICSTNQFTVDAMMGAST
eukprot:UN03131